MRSFYHGDINEFADWLDTDGNIINASDGGIIFADGKYHWYGQALRPLPMSGGPYGGQMTDVGVVMYESSDLLNWKYEGVILEVSSDPASELYAPMRFEPSDMDRIRVVGLVTQVTKGINGRKANSVRAEQNASELMDNLKRMNADELKRFNQIYTEYMRQKK